MQKNFGAVLVAAGAFFGGPAQAQEETIVVTATRFPAQTKDLPARIQSVDRAEIEARSLSTLAEAIGNDAVQAGGAGQQTSVFLRGANSKHVLALLDGVRLNDASTPNAQYDFGIDALGGLDRVEVLRGPASAIYGSDAIGGVVNMLPRRGGSDAFEPFWEVALGELDTRRALVGMAGSLDSFEYGASAEWLSAGGHDLVPSRMSTHTADADGAEIGTITAALRRDGPLGLDALLRVRDASAEFDTFSGGPNFDLRADDPDLENESRQVLWRLGVDAEPESDVVLRLSGGQVASDRAEIDGGVETSSAESERSFVDATARYATEFANVTAGVSFERNAIDTRPQFAAPLSADEDLYAAYVIGQIEASPHVDVTAALRVDNYENFGEQATYSIGAVYAFANARVFASYGEAFKAPSLSERFETSLFNIGNPDLEPETSRSWEAGVDFRLLEGVRVGGSYYLTRITNLIEYDFAALQNVNLGRAEIEGSEAYLEAQPAAWANVRVAYAWTDARNGATGVPLARRPEHALRIEARIAPTERFALTGSWSYIGERVDVAYDDAGQFVSANGIAEAFGMGAVAATFDLDAGVQLFARVDNITDETYEQPLAFAGPPRAATIGVRARSR